MIHSQRIGVAGGTTAGTYGTAVELQLPNFARQVVALLCIGADVTKTAEEGSIQQLRINIADLGYVNQVFPVGPYQTSGPATNDSGYPSNINIIPVDWPVHGKEVISVDIAPQGASTAAKLFEVAALFADEQGPPKDWKDKFPECVARRGGMVVGAAQTTTTRTALTAITIPSWAKEIISVQGLIVKTGAITTAEEGIGYFDFETTIKGTTPQQYPSSIAQGASIGTPVGTGQVHLSPAKIPTHIPLTGQTETLTPYITLRTAISTGNRVAFAVEWR